MRDPIGEDGDLNLGRTRVAVAVAYSSMIFFLVAASIDTDLLSVSRCAALPNTPWGFTRCEWELLEVRGRSNGAPNLPARHLCSEFS
jgi:hypothetical protein